MKYYQATVIRTLLLFISLVFFTTSSWAGVGLDEPVYHPYVKPKQQEIEISLIDLKARGSVSSYTDFTQLSYGRTVNDKVFVQGAAAFDNVLGGVDAYEVEAKMQLTQRGQYDADFGVLVAIERAREDFWRAQSALLVAHDFQRFTALLNLGVGYEKAKNQSGEFETLLAAKMAYRYLPHLAPAVELLVAEDALLVGPAADGRFPLSQGRNLNWGSALLFGSGKQAPKFAFRLSLEYEFL